MYKFLIADKSLQDTVSDVFSDSSSCGASESDVSSSLTCIRGSTVLCVEGYSSGIPGHLSIDEGDILEGNIFYCAFFILQLKANW